VGIELERTLELPPSLIQLAFGQVDESQHFVRGRAVGREIDGLLCLARRGLDFPRARRDRTRFTRNAPSRGWISTARRNAVTRPRFAPWR
jgi:hypothetical protein